MAILRKQKTGNFTTVNNYFINDPNLKPNGKGFLLFMLSEPDDWKFNFINFQKSLCIIRNSKLHCFDNNNWQIEKRTCTRSIFRYYLRC